MKKRRLETSESVEVDRGNVGNARPIKIDLPFEEAVSRILNVKPAPKSPKKKSPKSDIKPHTRHAFLF